MNPASKPSTRLAPAQINVRASSAFPNFKHKSNSDSLNPPSGREWLTFIMEPLNSQWPCSQRRFIFPYNSLMWTYTPPGSLVQLSGQNEHVQNSLTLSTLQTQWLLAHFNLIYLVKGNANAKLSCTSRSCAGSCLPETACRGCPELSELVALLCTALSDTGLTFGHKVKQISIKSWLWGITEQHSLLSFRVREYLM